MYIDLIKRFLLQKALQMFIPIKTSQRSNYFPRLHNFKACNKPTINV